MTCQFCHRKATHNYMGNNYCENHYAQIDRGRAGFVAIHARDFPPWRIAERIELVSILVEMLGVDEVREILGKESWYKRLKSQENQPKEELGG